VRYNVVIGSATAVLLFGAITAVLVQYRSMIPGFTNRQVAAVSPAGPAPGATEPAKPGPPPPAAIAPSFDIVKVGPGGSAVIAGRAEPGSKVVVRDGDNVIGEVTADRRGEWVLVPDKPIGPGDRLLSLEASNAESGALVRSNETLALSVAPSATGTKEGALAVVLPREGTGAARVLQRPEQASPEAPAAGKAVALAVDAVEHDAQGRVVLSGHAPPKATLQIYLGNQPFATATADAAGAWTATSAQAAVRRQAELRIDQLAEDGHVMQRVALPLARAAVQLAAGQDYVVQRGNSLWQIAKRTYGIGTRYLIIYSANLAQIRDPGRIYPGQVFKLPKS
jgi:nucleoid-associated protein YgaU